MWITFNCGKHTQELFGLIVFRVSALACAEKHMKAIPQKVAAYFLNAGDAKTLP